jgi:hypothetical protein
MGHLETGNAAGIEELARRAASAVVASPAGQAVEVRGSAVQPVHWAGQVVLSYTSPHRVVDICETFCSKAKHGSHGLIQEGQRGRWD